LLFHKDFHIQFVVWIISGIKNIMKMSCNYVCSFPHYILEYRF
jgi:hypothetical protein